MYLNKWKTNPSSCLRVNTNKNCYLVINTEATIIKSQNNESLNQNKHTWRTGELISKIYLRFWTHVEQVEPVNISWNASVLRIVTKYAKTSTLGELAIFIVQIFCNKNQYQFGKYSEHKNTPVCDYLHNMVHQSCPNVPMTTQVVSRNNACLAVMTKHTKTNGKI